MLQNIVFILLFIIFYITYKFIVNNQKKFDYSPLFLRIENIYTVWFRKKGSILTLRKTSVKKISYTIFELVIMLKDDGINIEDIKKYRKIIDRPVNRIKWY